MANRIKTVFIAFILPTRWTAVYFAFHFEGNRPEEMDEPKSYERLTPDFCQDARERMTNNGSDLAGLSDNENVASGWQLADDHSIGPKD